MKFRPLLPLVLLVGGLLRLPSICVAWLPLLPHRSEKLTGTQRRRPSISLNYRSISTLEEQKSKISNAADAVVVADDDAKAALHEHTPTDDDNDNNNSGSNIRELVKSVNYFISRKCNYACQFCFHTQKSSTHLTLDQAKAGLQLLARAGTQKINFAGGEPFLHPTLLGELCRFASRDLNMAVSIISNGSLITKAWMEQYGRYVDVMGVSVDSFDDATNTAIGRTTATGSIKNNDAAVPNQHVHRILQVRELCRQHDIIFKVNTVVCRLNWQEDMTQHIQQLDPQRWKIFQILLLKDENMGRPNNLRDARPLVITHAEFDAFLHRHAPHISRDMMKPESNAEMQNSYLLLDEEMRFLDCSMGGKVPGASILDVGVEQALSQAGFDHAMFQQRGGVYNWKRERKEE